MINNHNIRMVIMWVIIIVATIKAGLVGMLLALAAAYFFVNIKITWKKKQ